MTNRDRINNMSNTELAEFMAKLSAIYVEDWRTTDFRAADKSCYSARAVEGKAEDTEALDACTAANVAWLESEAENCGN